MNAHQLDLARAGRSWKCSPRRVCRRGLWIVLLWTTRIGETVLGELSSQKVRAEKAALVSVGLDVDQEGALEPASR